jgi:CRP-like cAMP-binding protein
VTYDKSLYLACLKMVPMFSACSTDELQAVADLATVRHARADEVLITQGEPGSEFFVISTGEARVERDGNEVGALGPGDFFGELALFDSAPRNASVVATDNVTAVVLAQHDFNSLLRASDPIRDSLLRGMARRLHQLDAKL